jgi:hypothetical protein
MLASEKTAWMNLVRGHAAASAVADRARLPVPSDEALARLVTLQRIARERGTATPSEAQRQENLAFYLRWQVLRQRLSDE